MERWLSHDLPPLNQEQQDRQDWADELFEKYDAMRHRTFDLEVQRVLSETIKKESEDGTNTTR